jgi:hypothetical protein
MTAAVSLFYYTLKFLVCINAGFIFIPKKEQTLRVFKNKVQRTVFGPKLNGVTSGMETST